MHPHLPLLCVLALGSAGCESGSDDWREDYDWVWAGEHVTVYGYEREQEDVCGGSLAALDLHSASVADFMGYEAVQYDYRLLSDQLFEGKCPPGTVACTASGTPWTRSIPHMHEATHAVNYAGLGHSCPSLLEEGLAEYFGTPRFYSFGDPKSGDYEAWIGDLLTAAPVQLRDYERAGNFVSFLIEEFGPDAVSQLCREIPFYSTLDDWHAVVPEVLGLDVAELLYAYEQYPRCHRQQYRARLWECAGEPDVTASPDETIMFEVPLDCADERVMGPLGDRIVTTRRIFFPEAITADVTLRDSEGAELEFDFNLQQCAPCSQTPDVYAKSELFPAFWFEPGVYELLIFAGLDFSETISVSVEPM